MNLGCFKNNTTHDAVRSYQNKKNAEQLIMTFFKIERFNYSSTKYLSARPRSSVALFMSRRMLLRSARAVGSVILSTAALTRLESSIHVYRASLMAVTASSYSRSDVVGPPMSFADVWFCLSAAAGEATARTAAGVAAVAAGAADDVVEIAATGEIVVEVEVIKLCLAQRQQEPLI